MVPLSNVHRWPQILPGGKAVIFTAYRSLAGLDGATIEVESLRDGRRKTLVRDGTWGRYLPSGHLVYIT
jgi:serine/threonine-protein kinase